MARLLPFCVLASTILTLAGCQQARDMNEMKATTNEMRDITRDMRDETHQMNQTTGKMNKATNSMNDSMQLKEMIRNTSEMNKTTQTMNGSLLDMKSSMDVMRTNTEALASKMDHLGKITEVNLTETNSRMRTMSGHMESMDSTTTGLCQSRNPQAADMRLKGFDGLRKETQIETKAADAMLFEMGMEFHMWGLCANDTLATRDDMFRIALEEFFAKLKAVTSSHASARALAPSYVAPNSDSLLDADFDAVAYALTAVHDIQKNTLAKMNAGKPENQKVQIATLQSLIIDAYLANKSGQSLKPWQKMVIANNGLALRVLQARHNFLIAGVIGKLKDQAVKGVGNNIALGFNKLMGGLAGTAWSADVSALQPAELDNLTSFIQQSIETRQKLVSIGVKPVLDSELAPFIHNLTVTDDKRGNAKTNEARARFKSIIKTVQTQL
jgi:hypothetical protein